jgi:hypothetical protein
VDIRQCDAVPVHVAPTGTPALTLTLGLNGKISG